MYLGDYPIYNALEPAPFEDYYFSNSSDEFASDKRKVEANKSRNLFEALIFCFFLIKQKEKRNIL